MNRLKAHANIPVAAAIGLILLLFLALQLLSLAEGIGNQPGRITSGTVQQFSCDDPSVALTPWTAVTLPHWERGLESPVRCLRMTTVVTREQLASEHGPTKLMLNAMGGLGRVWLNGEKIDESLHSDRNRRVLWLRPYTTPIPSHLVRQTNVMMFEFFNYQPVFQLGQILISEEPKIESMMRLITFISKTTTDGSVVLFGILGSFLISFSILFKRERLIGLVGKSMFGWSMMLNLLTMAEVPGDLYVLWQTVMYGFIAWSILSFVDFFMIISEAKADPVFTKIRDLIGVTGVLACLYFGSDSVYYINIYWLGFLNLYCLYVLARCVLTANILLKTEGQLLAVQASLCLVTNIHDYLVASGQIKYLWMLFGDVLPRIFFAEIFLMPFGMTGLLLVMGAIVLKRYRTSQNYQMAEATRIAKALQHSEERLREVLQKQQAINNIKLIQSERERLLMEIHDGVGSQLISGMLLAKKQDLSQETLLDMFQVCMDDVKVIIDCISLGKPANAAHMIGAMLERQRQRLLGLGITLRFLPSSKRNAFNHDISDAQCLHASRIVQECIANAIKHAQCNSITVQLRQYRDHILVVIRDNGEGLAPVDRMELGRGLKNMRKRARLLAGQIRFLSRPDGFVVTLRFKNTVSEEWKQVA